MTLAAITAALGGSGSLGKSVDSPLDLVALTREGLPAEILSTLADDLSLDRASVARMIGISRRTLSRRMAAHGRLSADESDRAVRLARVMARATDVLGDKAKASHWLQTPNRALAGRKPLELLDTDAGVQSVDTILGRIAYGVYS